MGLFGKILADAASNYAANQSAKKGMYISGFPNYKPGHYGPTPTAKELAEKTENPLARKAIGGADRVLGLGRVGLEGIKNAAKMQMPGNRALYMGGGVNRPLMESPIMKQGVDPEGELLGRGLYNRHITEQSGQVPLSGKQDLDVVLNKLGFTGNYRNIDDGFYTSFANRWADNKTQTVSKKEAKVIEDHISSVWKDGEGVPIGDAPDSRFLWRRFRGPESNHWNTFRLSKQVNALGKQVFGKNQKNPKTIGELEDRVKNATFVEKDPFTNKPMKDDEGNIIKHKLNIKQVDDDGVWVTFARAGSPITEGSANFLVKLKKDGKGFFVMSDEHNHLEKFKSIADRLPNRVLTGTPPVHFNLKSMSPTQTGGVDTRGRKATRDLTRRISPEAKAEKKAPKLDILKYTTSLDPKQQEVYRKELAKAYAKLGTGTGMLGYGLSEDE